MASVTVKDPVTGESEPTRPKEREGGKGGSSADGQFFRAVTMSAAASTMFPLAVLLNFGQMAAVLGDWTATLLALASGFPFGFLFYVLTRTKPENKRAVAYSMFTAVFALPMLAACLYAQMLPLGLRAGGGVDERDELRRTAGWFFAAVALCALAQENAVRMLGDSKHLRPMRWWSGSGWDGGSKWAMRVHVVVIVTSIVMLSWMSAVYATYLPDLHLVEVATRVKDAVFLLLAFQAPYMYSAYLPYSGWTPLTPPRLKPLYHAAYVASHLAAMWVMYTLYPRPDAAEFACAAAACVSAVFAVRFVSQNRFAAFAAGSASAFAAVYSRTVGLV